MTGASHKTVHAPVVPTFRKGRERWGTLFCANFRRQSQDANSLGLVPLLEYLIFLACGCPLAIQRRINLLHHGVDVQFTREKFIH